MTALSQEKAAYGAARTKDVLFGIQAIEENGKILYTTFNPRGADSQGKLWDATGSVVTVLTTSHDVSHFQANVTAHGFYRQTGVPNIPVQIIAVISVPKSGPQTLEILVENFNTRAVLFATTAPEPVLEGFIYIDDGGLMSDAQTVTPAPVSTPVS